MPMMIVSPAQGYEVSALREVLESIVGEELPGWDAVSASARFIELPRGTRVYTQGETHPYLYYLRSGLLKATHRLGGTEKIAGFVLPHEASVISSGLLRLAPEFERVLALYGSRRSGIRTGLEHAGVDHSLTAVSDATLLRLDAEGIAELTRGSLAWARLAFLITVFHLSVRNARVRDLLMLTPEERYEKVLREEPELARHITRRDLALYLGITRESLSRIAERVRRTHPDLAALSA